jgi:type I restriction enzyme, R subunit
LREIIDAYHSGSSSADNYFDELVKFTQNLKEESERHIREGLTKDELEIFDLLKKEKMTKEETQRVKLAAKSLLHRLLEEPPPVLIGSKTLNQKRLFNRQSKKCFTTICRKPTTALSSEKCHNVFDLILSYASQGLKWAS